MNRQSDRWAHRWKVKRKSDAHIHHLTIYACSKFHAKTTCIFEVIAGSAFSHYKPMVTSSCHSNRSLYFYSILFYPITLEGRRGTTDEFATIHFHLDLFSAALAELAKSIPVHSLILSSHLFFCLPLFSFSFHCAL